MENSKSNFIRKVLKEQGSKLKIESSNNEIIIHLDNSYELVIPRKGNLKIRGIFVG